MANQPDEDSPPASPTGLLSPISPPPYWHPDDSASNVSTAQNETEQHNETASRTQKDRNSRRSPGPIQLEDHTHADSERSQACWARSVHVDGWIVVGASAGAVGVPGSYVVFSVVVETDGGNVITIRKRYSEFDTLRANLARIFPNSRGAMPNLPPKSILLRFEKKFLEKRRKGLEYFLNCILLNPEFSASPVLKDFLFS